MSERRPEYGALQPDRLARADGIYNPASLTPDELLEEFIGRQRLLGDVLDVIASNRRGESPQHLLFIGARGTGKTMTVLAIAYSVERDPRLADEWVSVVLPEEVHYGVADLADFWLLACEQLFARLGDADVDAQVDALRAGDPESVEEQARDAFLARLDRAGRRAVVCVENLNEFFEQVSDDRQEHRLRAFLMEDDRVMLIGTATTWFDAVTNVDRPFFDFFRDLRLQRFDREEVFETLRRVAEVRGDQSVLEVLEREPERVDSLRVLTGGNPRLIKVVYRLLREGAFGDVRRDLERLLDDCTPYFKHRIEELSPEQRRVFDALAKKWDPVSVGDLEKVLRRPSNKLSVLLKRLCDQGFVEEAAGSKPKRKRYQVAERFYNIYYLMRFSRSGRQRLEWLSAYMRVVYTAEDYREWVGRALAGWGEAGDGQGRQELAELLHALVTAPEDRVLGAELVESIARASWDMDRLSSFGDLLDRGVAEGRLGPGARVVEWLSGQSSEVRESLGHEPDSERWWYRLLLAACRVGDLEGSTRVARAASNRFGENPLFPYAEGLVALACARAFAEAGDERSADALGLASEHARRAASLSSGDPVASAAVGELLLHCGVPDEPRRLILGGATEGISRPAWRLYFRKVLGTDPDSWITILKPTTAALRSSAPADDGLREFLVRGVEFLLSDSTIEPAEVESLLVEGGAESSMPDLLLALQALREPAVLHDVAPERRTATLDFLSKVGRPVDPPTP